MKKILALSLVLILCVSMLLCSCFEGSNDNTTTTTTTTTTTPPQQGGNPFGDLTWEDILSGNFENLDISLPECEISISGLEDTDDSILMLQNIKIKDNVIYFPCTNVDGYDSGYERAGRYIVFDGTKMYAVDCMSEEEYEVNVSDFAELSSEVDFSQLEAMMEEFAAILEEFPELTDEYKDYSVSDTEGEYRIDKEYFKEVIEFIYEKIGEMSGEQMGEIPAEVWAIIDEMTIEVDVTEIDGVVSSIEGVVAYEYEGVIDFSLEFAMNEENVSLEMSLDIPSEEVSCELQILANAETVSYSVNVEAPGTSLDMSFVMLITDTAVDMTFEFDSSSEYNETYEWGTGVDTYDTYEDYSKDDMSFLMELTIDISNINTTGKKILDFNFDATQSYEYTSKCNGVLEYEDSYETAVNASAYIQLNSDGGYDFGLNASADGEDVAEILGTLTFTEVTVPDVSDLIADAE